MTSKNRERESADPDGGSKGVLWGDEERWGKGRL